MNKSNTSPSNYQSPRRYAPGNNTYLSAAQLKEQMNSIGLPARAPALPSTYDLFGTDEDKYIPSGFISNASPNKQYLNYLENAGNKISFVWLVKGLAKKVATGRGKPASALAYAAYFSYLSKALTATATKLQDAQQEQDAYIASLSEYESVKESFEIQARYERNLSSFDYNQIELEEAHENSKADLEAKDAELSSKLAEVEIKQGKLTSLMQKFSKGSAK